MKHLVLAILIVLLILSVLPVSGQETLETEEPPVALTATPEPDIVVLPAPTSGQVTLSAFELLGIIVTSVLSGAGTVLGGLGVAIRYIMNSTVLIRFLELLAKSIQPETRQFLRDAAELAEKVLDDEDTDISDAPTGPQF